MLGRAMDIEERGVDVVLEVKDAAKSRAIVAVVGLVKKTAMWSWGG